MRKLLTIDNFPATKSEVVKEVGKILGKTAVWTLVGYVTIVAGLIVIGKKELEAQAKEEKNS